MASFFLSYARADDSEFVRLLHDALLTAGHDVWLDQNSMPERGLPFTRELALAIEKSDRMLLILGQQALISRYVEAEWTYAEAIGKPIHPIIRGVELSCLPRGLAGFNVHDFGSDARFTEELRSLLRACAKPIPCAGPLLGCVPAIPHNLESRQDVRLRLREILIGGVNPPTLVGSAPVCVIHGPGGRGKTVVAALVANDFSVRRVFSDGVIWVPISQDLGDYELVRRQRDLIQGIGMSDELKKHQSEQAQIIAGLRNRRFLVIIDDAWTQKQCEAFGVGSDIGQSRFLISTRDRRLVRNLKQKLDIAGVFIDALPHDRSMRLFAAAAGLTTDELPSEALEVFRWACGEPRRLLTCGSMGRQDPILWREFDKAPSRYRSPDEVDVHDPWSELYRDIGLSVQALPHQRRDRYRLLAALPRNSLVPAPLVGRLWSDEYPVPLFEVIDTLRLFDDLNLLRLDRDSNVSLHDHNIDYLRAIAGADIGTLKSRFDNSVTAHLLQGLQSPDPAVRDAAVSLSIRFQHASTKYLEALAEILSREQSYITHAITRAVVHLRKEPVSELVRCTLLEIVESCVTSRRNVDALHRGADALSFASRIDWPVGSKRDRLLTAAEVLHRAVFGSDASIQVRAAIKSFQQEDSCILQRRQQ